MQTHHLNLPEDRRTEVKRRRSDAADFYEDLHLTKQHPNGDKELYQIYSKGLQHDSLGVVMPSSYQSLLHALDSGKPSDFEAIQVGFSGFDDQHRQKLTDPQCGIAFDTEGPDALQYAMPSAPKFSSKETMGEIAENYWMALLRDVPFSEYSGNPVAQAAATHLTSFSADFKGPKVGAAVTTDTLFRTSLPGATAGPYISQFMIFDVPYGSQKTSAKVAYGFGPNQDYLRNPADYLQAQAGFVAAKPAPLPVPVYMRNGRDLAQYVHIDELFQGYLNACLLLITPSNRGGFGAKPAGGNPYSSSATQMGFGTLGEPNFKVAIAEIASRALKAVWYQKWFVHRRLRPEVFAARIHYQKTAAANYGLDLSNMADLLQRIKVVNSPSNPSSDSYLLPMAFPEGSPTHPAYGAGHATVGGACVTLLKALFMDAKLSDLSVVPKNISLDGLSDTPYTGGDLTIHGELNKLAGSVGMARNIAGVHWRSDFTESLKLGECVALNFLRETAWTYNEDVCYRFPLFSGETITINKQKPKEWKPLSACECLMKEC